MREEQRVELVPLWCASEKDFQRACREGILSDAPPLVDGRVEHLIIAGLT